MYAVGTNLVGQQSSGNYQEFQDWGMARNHLVSILQKDWWDIPVWSSTFNMYATAVNSASTLDPGTDAVYVIRNQEYWLQQIHS